MFHFTHDKEISHGYNRNNLNNFQFFFKFLTCLTYFCIDICRFQAPKISAQQQHSNKILQKAREARAKRFGAVQNIPVIGSTKQATKRPSTDDENASPPKMAKSAPNISTESAVKVDILDMKSNCRSNFMPS